mmetsp:Transcript_175864/g.563848  ORF Transcript_175864/g.563848 Transcript_175864/m.563848 type:complete len:262 (-) Transcript_175864:328-1113(-)
MAPSAASVPFPSAWPCAAASAACAGAAGARHLWAPRPDEPAYVVLSGLVCASGALERERCGLAAGGCGERERCGPAAGGGGTASHLEETWPVSTEEDPQAFLATPPGLEEARVGKSVEDAPPSAAPDVTPLGAVLACQVPEIVRRSERGDVAGVLELLRAGAGPSMQDDFGIAALHGAAKKGHVEVAQLLVDWGADVHAKQRWGETPLHYACKYGRTAVVSLLLAHGADAEAGCAKGQTPADVAQKRHHYGVLSVLSAKGP